MHTPTCFRYFEYIDLYIDSLTQLRLRLLLYTMTVCVYMCVQWTRNRFQLLSCLISVLHLTLCALDSGQVSALELLDLSAAFDLVCNELWTGVSS